jgi:hypothetical protein
MVQGYISPNNFPHQQEPTTTKKEPLRSATGAPNLGNINPQKE